MVLFLFYRKSLRFMLPLALAVSFSRVYNGVHYPSDVLAGAIIGAGYAVAAAVAIESAWQYAGKKWFSRWHAKLPSLLPNLHGERVDAGFMKSAFPSCYGRVLAFTPPTLILSPYCRWVT